jgi:hypothetical protein
MDPARALCQCIDPNDAARIQWKPETLMTEASEAMAAQPAAAREWLATALAILRQRLWLVAAIAVMALFGAVIYLRGADYTYTATMRVAPAPTTARDSANIGALTSLATLTGASLEAIPVTPFRLYVEAVDTREIATRLAADPALMHAIFAEEWDAGARQWRDPGGAGAALQRSILDLAGAPQKPWTPPDAARLQQWIVEHVAIDQTPKTPIVSISVATRDRALGITLLGRLHTTVDEWLRARTIARTTNNIQYLINKLPTVALADHRLALIATLNDQEQRLMLARNPAAYAAERFGPITASPQPTSPRQVPVLIVALVFGAFLGVVAALLVPRRQRG